MPVLLMEDWKRNAYTAHRIPPYLSFPQHRTMLVTQQKAFFGFYFCIKHTHTHDLPSTMFLSRRDVHTIRNNLMCALPRLMPESHH